MYAGLSVAEIMSEKIIDCCSAAVMNSNGIDEIGNFHVDLFMKITSAERILRSAKGRKSNDSIHMFS